MAEVVVDPAGGVVAGAAAELELGDSAEFRRACGLETERVGAGDR